jgi:hypothetical protein
MFCLHPFFGSYLFTIISTFIDRRGAKVIRINWEIAREFKKIFAIEILVKKTISSLNSCEIHDAWRN